MNKYSLIAILSAFLYALSIPISKIFVLHNISPIVLGGFTYLGAGIGLLLFNAKNSFRFKNPLTKKEMPYTIAMVILDIFAITFLMLGLKRVNSSTTSLLSNVEIVSTSLIAFIIFNEKISKKMWSAIILIIFASLILSLNDFNIQFNIGSFLVLLSFIFWGIENNCTKMISSKNTTEITIIKGLSSGIISLIIAHFFKFNFPDIKTILLILTMGFISYGVSVSLYIYSQNKLGAAKTASYFSFVPYFGVILSIIFLMEIPDIKFYIAFLIMLFAGILISKDNKLN